MANKENWIVGRSDDDGYLEDTGCPDLGIPECKSCPLSQCRFDISRSGAAAVELNVLRLQALLAQGLTREECRERLGVSRSTMFRLLRRLPGTPSTH